MVRTTGPLFQSVARIESACESCPTSRTFIPEESNYPTLDVNVDRVSAARLGLTQKDVVTNVITALTSNQMIAPSIWIDPKTGNDYFLTAQYASKRINSIETLLDIPVRSSDGDHSRATQSISLRNVATIWCRRNIPPKPTTTTSNASSTCWSHRSTSDLGGTKPRSKAASKA